MLGLAEQPGRLAANPGTARDAGAIARVSGPLVEVEGLAGVAMYELVDLGPRRLPGEVVGIRDGVLTVQAYEYTGGLRPGDPARACGEPLSVPLGPGPARQRVRRLAPAAVRHAGLAVSASGRGAAPRRAEWHFGPSATAGDSVVAGRPARHRGPGGGSRAAGAGASGLVRGA